MASKRALRCALKSIFQKPQNIRTISEQLGISFRPSSQFSIWSRTRGYTFNLQCRSLHTTSSDEEYQPPPYVNINQLTNYYFPPKNYERSLKISNVPWCAIETDIRRLLEGLGSNPDLVHTTYHPFTGGNFSGQFGVRFRNVAECQHALQVIKGVSLFNRKLDAVPFPMLKISYRPELGWGWHKTKEPSLKSLKLRAPLLTPPTGIFKPLDEGRRLTIENMPRTIRDSFRNKPEIYKLLHNFDVTCISHYKNKKVTDGGPVPPGRVSGHMWVIQLATHEEAEVVRAKYRGHILSTGHRLRISYCKPPKRFLEEVSRDIGLEGVHNTARDQSSAAGIDTEADRHLLYRKWLLGENDRGLYVPDHQY